MGILLATIQSAFVSMENRNRQLLQLISEPQLFAKPREAYGQFSCGEYLLRSTAMVEQTFNGITTRLWDDPYEWTLPEKLSSRSLISDYMDEVAVSRVNGFGYLRSDADLSQAMPAPSEIKSLGAILVEALASAEHFAGRAFAVFQFYSDDRLPRR